MYSATITFKDETSITVNNFYKVAWTPNHIVFQMDNYDIQLVQAYAAESIKEVVTAVC